VKPVGVGVIGCGNISAAYLTAARKFPILDIVALSDANPAAAEARAAEFAVPARSVDDVLADTGVEIVLNLTVPKAHVEVGLKAIAAGKHVHSEKPLGVTVAEARTLIEAAADKGLRVGCAPDTFLGGAHQTVRTCVDEGLIGRPIGGAAFFMCPGHERWHPNPGFYYLRGGGPMLDMGPYYVTDLVNLLGPVASVSAVATRTRSERIVRSQPLAGTRIPVEVSTQARSNRALRRGRIAHRARPELFRRQNRVCYGNRGLA
jgi:predicted dehydrogenase